MTKELYFVDTLVSVKYNKALKALLLCCTQFRLMLYLSLESHLVYV